jgi:hypothetical protein
MGFGWRLGLGVGIRFKPQRHEAKAGVQSKFRPLTILFEMTAKGREVGGLYKQSFPVVLLTSTLFQWTAGAGSVMMESLQIRRRKLILQVTALRIFQSRGVPRPTVLGLKDY